MTALPDGWRLTPLGAIADTALGKMLDKGKSRGLPRVPYLRNVNVQWGRIDTHDLREMELGDDERERFGVRRGDLLVCEGGEVGRAAIWDRDTEFVAYQKALHRVRPHEGVDARYLRYALENAARSGVFAPFTTGSTIAHLPQQNLRRVPLAVAPWREQRRIVEILEDHISRLDAGGAYLRASLLRCSRLIESWLHHSLDSGPAANRRLGDVIAESRGGWSRSRSHLVGPGEGTPYLKMNNIARNGDLVLDDVVHVVATHGDLDKYAIRPGDVLFNSKNSGDLIGKASVADERVSGWVFNENIMRLRFGPDVDPMYAALWLLGPQARQQITRSASASTNVAAVYFQALREFEMWVPDLEVQRSLVAEYRERRVVADRLAHELNAQLRRSVSMRRSLLAAAFSGRLTGASSDVDRIEELAEVGV